MAKAAVELPDPLDTPREGGISPLTSTDDLLAQLAGEEIDRLLAEVEEHQASAEPLPAPPPPAPPMQLPSRVVPIIPDEPVEPQGASKVALVADVPAAPEPVEAPPAIDEAAGAAAMAAAGPDLTAELDAFFKTATPKAPPAEVPAGEAAPPEAPPVARVELDETSAAERAGLNEPVAGPLTAPASPIPQAPLTASAVPQVAPDWDAAPADVDAEEGPLPILLRPLEWINAPLEACPQGLRDLIGKAAIITLVNAAAVLCYVMLFRRQ